MKRYFVNGVEISEEEAREISMDNERYSSSKDLNDWSKIKFITVIGTQTKGA